MIEVYKSIIQKARSKHQENRKFFKKLRKIKSGELDNMFTTYHDMFSKEIDCLKCANCCRGTGPLLKNKDIDKLSKILKMKSGLFIKTYLKTDDDGDLVFRELPCPFIDDNNYCIVYGDRPTACREYPHTDRRNIKKYLKPTLENCRICPIVYMAIEEMKKIIP